MPPIDKETINNCYVTRKDRTLVGVVSLRALVLEKNEQRPVEELMNPNVVSVVTSTDREDAAQLIEKYNIVKAAVAKKALPQCNIVCLTGEEMHSAVAGYLQVLSDLNPKAVGGQLPGEDFYYLNEKAE